MLQLLERPCCGCPGIFEGPLDGGALEDAAVTSRRPLPQLWRLRVIRLQSGWMHVASEGIFRRWQAYLCAGSLPVNFLAAGAAGRQLLC